MKKFINTMIMVMAVCFTFAFADVATANAESSLSLNGQVVTIKATPTTTTIQWANVVGASKYVITYADIAKIQKSETGEYTGETTSITVSANENTYTFKNIGDANYLVGVAPVDANGEKGANGFTYITPKRPKMVGINGVLDTITKATYNVTTGWSSVLCEGYQVKLVNAKGKVLSKAEYSDYSSVVHTFNSVGKGSAVYATVRAYNTYTGGDLKGQRYYSAWSKVTKLSIFVPQAKITSKNSDVKKGSVNMKWKKVKGATSYTIYAGTNVNKLKKVATTKKNHYKVTKIKGKSINTTKSYYYIAVKTNAKVKKKKVSSTKNYYVSAHTVVYRRYS